MTRNAHFGTVAELRRALDGFDPEALVWVEVVLLGGASESAMAHEIETGEDWSHPFLSDKTHSTVIITGTQVALG